jgi:hypothetical protein
VIIRKLADAMYTGAAGSTFAKLAATAPQTVQLAATDRWQLTAAAGSYSSADSAAVAG